MPAFEHLRQWARTLRQDVLALYLAARDPWVPWYAKAVAARVAVYALSPINLIPDCIPAHCCPARVRRHMAGDLLASDAVEDGINPPGCVGRTG